MIERLLRRVRGQVPFLAVLGIMFIAVGYLLIWPDHWRRGVGVIVLSMVVAGVLRLVLPEHRAGLLCVRGRWPDVAVYLLLAFAMAFASFQVS